MHGCFRLTIAQSRYGVDQQRRIREELVMLFSWLRLKQFACFLFPLGLVLSGTGCATPSSVVKKSSKELAAMEATANQAREKLRSGQYEEAVAIFEDLSRERTVSQPLYQNELAVAHLAGGDREKAYRTLREAQISIETFFEENAEKKAASLWGSENQKVYKGEPYERSTLYLLLGLMMLERNDVDNALACFKSGLLSDADVESEHYKSDYGLLQFLAAKCYELRGEQSLRDQHMQAAIHSYARSHPEVQPAVSVLYELEQVRGEGDGSIAELRNRLIEAYGTETENLATAEEIETFVNAKIEQRQAEDYFRHLLDPFNTLAIVWTGTAPHFIRYGRYGENRLVQVGDLPISDYELFADGTWYDCVRGFGSVTFQATTRGGRKMDDVLESQADLKGFTDDLGDSLIDAAGDVDHPGAAVILLLLGLISEGVSSAMAVEADIRSWCSIPSEFQVVPLDLTPGNHELRLCAFKYVSPLDARTVQVDIDAEKALNVVHVFAYDFGKEAIPDKLGVPQKNRDVFLMTSCRYDFLDRNLDGEVTDEELTAAYQEILNQFDADQDGELCDVERTNAKSWADRKFREGMVQQ